MNTLLTPEDMEQWGWRVPFLIGGVLLPIGVWVRSRIVETPVYIAAKESDAPSPSARTSTMLVLRAIVLMAAPVAGPYLLFTYFATYAVTFGGLTQGQALWSNTIGLIIVMLFTPLMGAWSDRIGRRPMLPRSISLLPGLVGLFIFKISQPRCRASSRSCVAGRARRRRRCLPRRMLGHCDGTCSDPRALAPAVDRLGAVGIALAGGFAPFIATWLIAWTGSTLRPPITSSPWRW